MRLNNLQLLQTVALVAASCYLCPAAAQMPRFPELGTIDFYGLRSISEDELRDLLPFSEGDTLTQEIAEWPTSDIAESLGAARITFMFVCCNESGLSMSYIGVEETVSTQFTYRKTPGGDYLLPSEIVADYRDAMDLLFEAVTTEDGKEDQSQGHSLLSYPPLRAIQNRFLIYAERDLEILLRVLHESADAEHRAASATVLGYVSDKAAITDDLVDAALDSNALVRNNATRSLAVIAQYAAANPELGIEIRADPFVDMLNSGVWTDLNKGSWMLSSLTKSRDPELLRHLQEHALQPLIDMCRWKSEGHAAAACVILQRILGLPEQESLHPKEATIAQAIELLPVATGDQ